MKKIVVTGGHLTPALALIEKLEAHGSCQIFFFGRKYSTEGIKTKSAEYSVVNQKVVKFITITTGRLQRRFTKYTIPSLTKIPIGTIQAFYNLVLIRPSVVVSFGGYLSTPVVFCAWLLGIDTIVHEQATVPGLANRINAIFAKKIFLTWSQTQKYFSGKTEVIGNLKRSAITSTKARDPKIREFLKKSKKLIFVTGGNQGSHFLNSETFKLLPHLGNFSVLHQVGTINYEGDLDRAKSIKNANYLPVDYLDSGNIGAVLNRADLVIARSGANTVWDLATLAKVSILIPLPIAASGEQRENAKVLEKAKSAVAISQEDAKEASILKAVREVFNNYEYYRKNADRLSKTLPKNAADILANFVLTSPSSS